MTTTEFARQLDGVQRTGVEDEGGFIVVEGRRPNLALQCRPRQLERLEDGRI